MAKITFTALPTGAVLYTWQGFTGESLEWIGEPLPEKVLAAFSLVIVSMSAGSYGNVPAPIVTTYERIPGSSLTECVLSPQEAGIRPSVDVAPGASLSAFGASFPGVVSLSTSSAVNGDMEANRQALGASANVGTGQDSATARRFVYAKDGTRVPEGFDWRLDVRPHAVEKCGLELRGEGKGRYIEQPYPAASKQSFRAEEHLRAQVFTYRVEAQKNREKRRL
jgi:hypothetical protein